MTEQQAQILRPKIALIGVGKGNRYGHPTEEILGMLDGIDAVVYRTDLDGGMRLSLQGGKAVVRHL